jgi:hypothetical protein
MPQCPGSPRRRSRPPPAASALEHRSAPSARVAGWCWRTLTLGESWLPHWRIMLTRRKLPRCLTDLPRGGSGVRCRRGQCQLRRQAHPGAQGRRMCLANITAEVHTPVVAGGTDNWVSGTIEHLAAPLVGTGLVTTGDITDCLALTADPSCHYATPAWSPPLPSARPHDHTWGHSRLRHGSRARTVAAARRTGSSGRKPLR